jgi:hypothetical protein
MRCIHADAYSLNGHPVRRIGSWGLTIGIGYECGGCWTRWHVTPDGSVVLGDPPAAPYPEWDFEED